MRYNRGMRFAALVFLLGCGKSHNEGLPPATDWATDDVTGGAKVQPPAASDDPHAGMLEDDPHAGVEGAPPLTGGDEIEAEDVAGHAPPQPADPATLIKGTLKLSPKLAGRIKPDGVIYLMVKTPGADGKPTGSALSVERLVWNGNGQPFELSGATGEVLVVARYDQDGEATKEQPGDVIGIARVKPPADKVVVELDTVVP